MKSTEIKKRVNRVCLTVLIFIGILSTLQIAQLFIVGLLHDLWGEESKAAEVLEGILHVLIYFVAYFSSILIFKACYSKDYVPMNTEKRLGSHPVAMISAALAICFAVSHFWGYFLPSKSGFSEIYHGQSIVIFMLTTVLLPAFCEELVFRGLIMTNLMPLGRNFAIISSGIIFGLIHGNHDQIFYATVAGIIIGWLYAETGTIWCGVILHMLNNFIAVIESVLWGILKTGTATKISMIINVFVLICGAVSLIYLIPVMRREKRRELSQGCFGRLSDKLLDSGTRFEFSEYVKGFFAPAMIALLCYVALNEVLYVFMF